MSLLAPLNKMEHAFGFWHFVMKVKYLKNTMYIVINLWHAKSEAKLAKKQTKTDPENKYEK